MFNPYVLESEFKKCELYKKRFKFLKKEKWAFFQRHKNEIIELNEIYDSFDNPEEADKFQSEHQVLRSFLLLDFLARQYKDEYRKALTSTKPFEKDRFIVGLLRKDEDDFDLYDIVTKEFVDLSIYDKVRKNYIVEGLKRSNSFICIIKEEQIPLLEVIVNDIKYKYTRISPEKVPTCADINIDFIIALLFDNPKQKNNLEKKQKLMDKKMEESYQRFSKGEITEDEFYIRYYYYMILKNNDVEKLYLRSDEEMKKYILEAYYKLSSYSEMNDEFTYHERTESPLINKRILKTKYGKEKE